MAAVSLIHAAGGDTSRWPEALAAITRLIGGAAATLEVLDRSARAHREFPGSTSHAPEEEIAYFAGYAANNPRLDVLMPSHKIGDLAWDYQFIDQQRMDKEPFYAAFLAPLDMRYTISGTIISNSEEYGIVSVQRTPQQGHIERREIGLMNCLVPHVRQAFDGNRRLAASAERQGNLSSALDWLADGVLMLAADGRVRYVNSAAQEILRRSDMVGLRDGALVFRAPGAAAKFGKAMVAISRLQGSRRRIGHACRFPDRPRA